MKISIRNLIAGVWMYVKVLGLHPIFKEIQKHKEAGDRKKEMEAIYKAEYKWSWQIINKMKINLSIQGKENVPDVPVLFVSNHQGYLDIPILAAAIDRQIGFVAKKQLGDLPIYGKWIKAVRSVFIDRDDPRSSLRTIDEGITLLKEGYSLAIFPEGTRSQGPEMGEFKKGSLRLATKPKVPVVPITINGTYRGLEEKGTYVPCDIQVFFHPPVNTADLNKHEASNLAETVEAIVKAKLVELNGTDHK